MLWLKNDLDWRLYKYRNGYRIARGHGTPYDRVRPLTPFLLNSVVCIYAYLFSDSRLLQSSLPALPLSLLVGFCLFRPAVVYLNSKSRQVMGGQFHPRLPTSRVVAGYVMEDGRYQLRVKDKQASWRLVIWKSTTEDGHRRLHARNMPTPWQLVIWESTTKEEIVTILNELRRCGIDVENEGHGS